MPHLHNIHILLHNHDHDHNTASWLWGVSWDGRANVRHPCRSPASGRRSIAAYAPAPPFALRLQRHVPTRSTFQVVHFNPPFWHPCPTTCRHPWRLFKRPRQLPRQRLGRDGCFRPIVDRVFSVSSSLKWELISTTLAAPGFIIAPFHNILENRDSPLLFFFRTPLSRKSRETSRQLS